MTKSRHRVFPNRHSPDFQPINDRICRDTAFSAIWNLTA